MTADDTIAAFATPLLPGGRIVLRLSGPAAHRLASQLCDDFVPGSGGARQSTLTYRGYRFPAWVYRFVAPHSYTGEDAIEFHLPGSPLLAQELLATLLHGGARLAEPGEFTARAFFNGKLDLTEAEGVAAVISAADANTARSARQLLGGELSRRLRPVMDRLSHTLARVEAEIDFSEEDVSFLPVDALRSAIESTRSELSTLLDGSSRLRPLSHEPTIAFVGRPNAGKSTLVNALAGTERSVVSAEAGTTRDVLSATLKLPSGTVTLLDLAGLESPSGTGSAVQQEVSLAVQQRAARALSTADRVVLAIAADDDRPPIQIAPAPDLIVITKAELRRRFAQGLHVSVHANTGLGELRAALDRLAFDVALGDTLMLNQRHEKNVTDAVAALDRAAVELGSLRPELVAAELRRSLDDLGAVLGVVTPDDILGKIFATFCIGK